MHYGVSTINTIITLSSENGRPLLSFFSLKYCHPRDYQSRIPASLNTRFFSEPSIAKNIFYLHVMLMMLFSFLYI